jgi:hypothetical protein
MTNEDQDFDSDESISPDVANRMIVVSSRGWDLYKLAESTDCHVGLVAGIPEQYETTDQIYEVQPFLTDEFQRLIKPIDLRQHIPSQLSNRLRLLARRLSEMAMIVDKVPCKPYQHAPKAYVVRDKKTDRLVDAHLWLSLAGNSGLGHESDFNSESLIHPDDIKNWPVLATRADTLAKVASGEIKLEPEELPGDEWKSQ